MEIPVISLVLMGIGTAITLIFCALLATGKKYDAYIQPLDPKEYPICETYVVGFKLMKMFPKLIKNKRTIDKRQYIEILYGSQYIDYYLNVSVAQTITMTFLMIVASFILFGFASDPLILVVMFAMTFAVFCYFDTLPKTKVEKRTQEISLEFANVVSKMALLINAGMIVREAWEQVAFSGEGKIYTEMQAVVEMLNNGASDVEAFGRFAMRCTTADVKKFTSTLIQGISKGNRELTEMLKEQNREMWKERERLVKLQGEKAASKLIIPMCIMLIGILIMVIIPIFANMGV